MANKAAAVYWAHMASSSGPYPSEKLRCHHCFRPMSEWHKPCFRGWREASDEGKS